MINRKKLVWHPMAEMPDFGRNGDKMRCLLLCSNKGYILPVTMNLDRWKHVGEVHMYPNSVKWTYGDDNQEGVK